ncbi:MAG TPA: DNA mismatch repair protein MutS [Thermoanaerobaculia bacterium]|nr:DNA mismatch repair protein MutS [Thermoanaerobaculia bacterium]
MKLLATGERAIPAVRDFLLDGEPEGVYPPRQRAVQVLGALGAKDVLLEYLRRPRHLENPAVAYAEEAVEITAARELRRWRSDEVFETLLAVLKRHLQPGAIEAIGDYRRAGALPFLVRALDDSISGAAAEEALRKYGSGARDALMAASSPRAQRLLAEMERFASILFPAPVGDIPEAPPFFPDLNLDQIVSAIAIRSPEYDLAPFFHVRLSTEEEIRYRHDVFRDLEREPVLHAVENFAERMRAMRKHLELSDKRSYPHEKERWFLSAVETYCSAVESFDRHLRDVTLDSRGLRLFREFLAEYAASGSFRRLDAEAKEVASALASIRYSLLIDGDAITVRDYAGERDASAAVEETFAKFRTGEAKDYRVKLKEMDGMNHVDAWVLERVARLHPAEFAALDRFHQSNRNVVDETIRRFDREIHFYTGYLNFIGDFRRAGLSFCYPTISESKDVSNTGGFDLALARKLLDDPKPRLVVTNDFSLSGAERIIVVSGPNQGGKTTFARTFGQMHYLGALGCLVPGTQARLFLFDRIFTHFEREEDIANLRGKLQDDLVRMRSIADRATPDSIVIINEIFASTTVRDALDLSRRILERLSRLDLVAVCVTFLDELATLNEKTVSMVSTVDPRDPAVRTFKVERRRADGLAYALAIAQKYGLTRRQLEERMRP